MSYHIHISYANADQGELETLAKYLDTFADVFGYRYWSRVQLIDGEESKKEIAASIADADAIIFLVTIDLFADKGDAEFDFELAMKQVEAGKALAVPILLRSMPAYERLPLSRFPHPAGIGPLDLEPNPDQAWAVVVEWIFKVFERLDTREVYRSFQSEDRNLFIDLAEQVNARWNQSR